MSWGGLELHSCAEIDVFEISRAVKANQTSLYRRVGSA